MYPSWDPINSLWLYPTYNGNENRGYMIDSIKLTDGSIKYIQMVDREFSYSIDIPSKDYFNAQVNSQIQGDGNVKVEIYFNGKKVSDDYLEGDSLTASFRYKYIP